MAGVEEDDALLQRASAGERAAFAQLRDALRAPVRHFTYRLLSNAADCFEAVDEIEQDVFFALHRNLARVQSAEHLRPFVYRVCRNLCYDLMRKQASRRTRPLEVDVPGACALPALAAPDDGIAWAILYGEVQRTIDRLPYRQRVALILYAEEGLSYEQIAEATRTDLGTVKWRIFYGRKRLRRFLRPDLLEALGLSG